jgi:hypothetical protein
MATTTRQSTKTITMPAATMTPPQESVPERVTQHKPAERGRFRLRGSTNERLVCDL